MVIERSCFMATAFGSDNAGENNFPSVWVSIALDLIPNVFFFPFDLVLAQQRAQFVLNSNLAVMFFLNRDVFLHPFGLRDGAPETREQMHMIHHAANENGRAIELFGDAAEVRVQRVTRGFVAQERTAVFGGENQMNVNGGQGLWHERKMAT